MTTSSARLRLLWSRMSVEQRGRAMRLEYAAEHSQSGRKCSPDQRLHIAERIVAGVPVSPDAVVRSCQPDQKAGHQSGEQLTVPFTRHEVTNAELGRRCLQPGSPGVGTAATETPRSRLR